MIESPELVAIVRRSLTAAFDHKDANALWNASRGAKERSRLVTASEEWDLGRDTLDNSKLIVQRAAEIGISSVEFVHVEAFEQGDVGWVYGLVVLHRGANEPSRQRFTGVWVLEEGAWRSAQFHMSIAVPAVDAYGVELSTKLDALVDSLDESVSAALGAASNMGTVTLLFSDVADSTQIAALLGDTEWATLIGRHLGTLHDIVESHEGRVVKTLGDGMMAAFSSVTNAMETAIEMQRRTADGLRIRVGLHTGDAVHEDGDYAGITVNKAARVAAAAKPDEILLSSVTAEMAMGRGFAVGDTQEVELKGLAGTHRLTQLLPTDPAD